MTENTVEQDTERRLRAARQAVFSENKDIADAAELEILECKKILEPFWRDRADRVRCERDKRFLFLTE